MFIVEGVLLLDHETEKDSDRLIRVVVAAGGFVAAGRIMTTEGGVPLCELMHHGTSALLVHATVGAVFAELVADGVCVMIARRRRRGGGQEERLMDIILSAIVSMCVAAFGTWRWRTRWGGWLQETPWIMGDDGGLDLPWICNGDWSRNGSRRGSRNSSRRGSGVGEEFIDESTGVGIGEILGGDGWKDDRDPDPFLIRHGQGAARTGGICPPGTDSGDSGICLLFLLLVIIVVIIIIKVFFFFF